MLRHIWQLAKEKSSSVEDQFGNVAWLARLLTLDQRVKDPSTEAEVEQWVRVRGNFTGILDRCENKDQLDTAVSECMKIAIPLLKNRFAEGYRFKRRPFGCWWYTIHKDETLVAVHFVNAYMPDSPFKNFAEFSKTLLEAIDVAQSKYPEINLVECGSWLNQTDKFQELWPLSFKNNQKVLNRRGGSGPGAWGQYMTTEGGFNKFKAFHLLEKGMHPYSLTENWCKVNDAVDHLKSLTRRLNQG